MTPASFPTSPASVSQFFPLCVLQSKPNRDMNRTKWDTKTGVDA